MSRRTLAAATLIAALTGIAAPAGAQSPFEHRRYAVEVTGTQVTDWQFRSAVPLNDDDGWTVGDGTQTIGWQTTRPARLGAMRSRVRSIGGVRLPAFALEGISRQPRIRGTVKRTARVQHLDRRPVCEGGTLDDDCLVVPLTVTPPQRCGQRALPVKVAVEVRDDDLRVKAEADPRARYDACGPDRGRFVLFEDLRHPMEIELKSVARRIARLGRGRRLELHRETRSEECPLPAPRPEWDACATTAVVVEITRTA